jgi:hypothetical protein
MRNLFFLFFTLCCFSAYAQKEAAHWYFGNGYSLDFNSDSPQFAQNGAMGSIAGSATFSDKNTGALLFYSNTKNVWNRFHQLMPNSSKEIYNNLFGSDQSCLVVPVPGKPSLYYFFSITDSLDSPGRRLVSQLKYTVIDMNLDGGKGDIVKEVWLKNNVSYRLTAVPKADKSGFWLLTHELNNNTFLVYGIDDEGIKAPVAQQVGSIHILTQSDYGYLKPSPDGSRLACTILDVGLDLFRFDAVTGIISDFTDLGRIETVGLSFSPDNTKLYVTTSAQSDPALPLVDFIRQYDLQAPDILASSMSIILNNPITNVGIGDLGDVIFVGGMQNGIDGKIYKINPGSSTISDTRKPNLLVINQPNKKGFDCQLSKSSINWDFSNFNPDAFPNFMEFYFNGLEAVENPADCRVSSLKVFPNPTVNEIFFEFDTECVSNFDVEVWTILGQKVISQRNKLQGESLKIINLAKGVYILRLILPNQHKIAKKIIKI